MAHMIDIFTQNLNTLRSQRAQCAFKLKCLLTAQDQLKKHAPTDIGKKHLSLQVQSHANELLWALIDAHNRIAVTEKSMYDSCQQFSRHNNNYQSLKSLTNQTEQAIYTEFQPLITETVDAILSNTDLKPLEASNRKLTGIIQSYFLEESKNYKPSYQLSINPSIPGGQSDAIVGVPAQKTKVRFIYADDESPIQNRYVIYWEYGKDGTSINTKTAEYYQLLSVMLPVGIGKTDAQGFLSQSLVLPNHQLQVITDKDGGTRFSVSPMSDTPGVFKYYPKDYFFVSGPHGDSWKSLRPTYNQWNEMYDIFNRNTLILDFDAIRAGRLPLPKKLIELYQLDEHDYITKASLRTLLPEFNFDDPDREIDFKHYFASDKAIQQSLPNPEQLPKANAAYLEKHQDAIVLKLAMDRKFNPYQYYTFVSKFVNARAFDKFQLDRKYGFFLYPGDGGPFSTKPLEWLASYKSEKTQKPVAWFDKVPVPPKDAHGVNAYTPVALHCTLPEWNARIRAKLDALKEKIDLKEQAAHGHIVNISNAATLRKYVNLILEYPYIDVELFKSDLPGNEHVVFDNIEKLKKDYQRKTELKTDLEAFENRIEKGIIDGEFGLKESNPAIDKAADDLIKLLQSPALIAELVDYKGSLPNNFNDKTRTAEPGPYMDREPYWVNIWHTLGECVAALEATSRRESAWKSLWQKIIDHIHNDQNNIKEFLYTKKDLEPYADEIAESIFRNSAGERVVEKSFDSGLGSRIAGIRPDDRRKESLYDETPIEDLADLITTYIKPLSDLVVAYPGPHTVLQVLLEKYNDKIIKAMLISKHSHFKIGIYLTKIFCWKMFGTDKQKKIDMFKRDLIKANLSPKGYRFFEKNGCCAKKGARPKHPDWPPRWTLPPANSCAPACIL